LRYLKGVAAAAAALVGIAFLYLQVSRAFTITPCCADDSFFSVIARFFSETLKYALPTSTTTYSLFDPRIGVGPALIVPGALMMKIFGPQYWVPGITVVLLFSSQAVASAWLLIRNFGSARALFFVMLAMLALIGATPDWPFFFIFIGEAPLLGFLLLGAVILATEGGTKRGVLIGGFTLSLALMTKLIGVFSVAGIGLAWLAREAGCQRSQLPERVSILAASLSAPLVAFEGVKLIALGQLRYVERWHEFFNLVSAQHISPPDRSLELQRVVATDLHFTLVTAAVVVLSSILVLSATVRLSSKDKGAYLGSLMLGGAICHISYFIFFSNLWARYLWPSVALTCFAISSPVLFASQRRPIPYIIALLILLASASGVGTFFTRDVRGISPSLRSEQQHVLETIGRHPGLPVVTQWWGSGYDIIYLLPSSRAWYVTNDERSVAGMKAIVAMNKRFIKNDVFYTRVSELCKQVVNSPAYELYLCDEGRNNP
jgi:hypothetical protein